VNVSSDAKLCLRLVGDGSFRQQEAAAAAAPEIGGNSTIFCSLGSGTSAAGFSVSVVVVVSRWPPDAAEHLCALSGKPRSPSGMSCSVFSAVDDMTLALRFVAFLTRCDAVRLVDGTWLAASGGGSMLPCFSFAMPSADAGAGIGACSEGVARGGIEGAAQLRWEKASSLPQAQPDAVMQNG
jgi:hypothetical protein